MVERSVGDLGGVKELAGIVEPEGVDEHSMGDTGDKVADAIVAGEHGHGVAVGLGPGSRCVEFGFTRALQFSQFDVVGALPRGAAAAEGGFGTGRPGLRAGLELGGARRVYEGIGEGIDFDGCFGHGGTSWKECAPKGANYMQTKGENLHQVEVLVGYGFGAAWQVFQKGWGS